MTELISSGPFAGHPRGGYRCIYADPAWRFKSWRAPEDPAKSRAPDRHYRSSMSLDEIRELPVGELADRDAWLFMWTTSPFLEQAFGVLRAWGFRYSTTVYWAKLNRRAPGLVFTPGDFFMGTGHVVRGNVEPCLVARRGRPRVVEKMRSLVVTPRRENSRKPDEMAMAIERFCAGPRVELFARESRAGWSTWGDEATKFDRETA